MKRLTKFLMLCTLLVLVGTGQMWGGDTNNYTTLKVNTVSPTGAGCVYVGNYASENPHWDTEMQATEQLSSGYTHYAWAKAVRGYSFSGWDHNTYITSITGTNPYTINVTSPTSNNGSINEGELTAVFATENPVDVTYKKAENGWYSIQYQYTTYNAQSRYLDDNDGFYYYLDEYGSDRTYTSYASDKVTLRARSANFAGWYSDPEYTQQLSNDEEYTYTVPAEGTAANVYAKFNVPTKKLYGKVNARLIAASAKDGGVLSSALLDNVDGLVFATSTSIPQISYLATDATSTTQTYYLHAKPTHAGMYVFRGWFETEDCSGTALSTDLDYTYTLANVSSTDVDAPTEKTLYACFDRCSSHYLEVAALPAIPGTGMVLMSDKLLATAPDVANYSNIAKTSLVVNTTNTTTQINAYAYAQPKYGYVFSGWYDNQACEGAALSTNNPFAYAAEAVSADATAPTKKTLYAKFALATPTATTYNATTNGAYISEALDVVDEDGAYVWGQKLVFNSTGKTENTVIPQYPTNALTLTAAPNCGFGVKNWIDGSKETDTVSYVYKTSVTAEAKAMGVSFESVKPYKVESTSNPENNDTYSDLQSAITAVGTAGKITVVHDAYLPEGTYTIPADVTFLVPYDEAGSVKGSKPTPVQNSKKVEQFRELILAEGAHLVVNGTMEVGGKMGSAGGGQSDVVAGGGVAEAYGKVVLNKNSRIDIQNGASLYTWGFITGPGVTDRCMTSGEVHINKGGNVYEGFQLMDFKGGTISSNMGRKVFPLNQFYIQNVEVPMTLHYGATEFMVSCLYAASSNNRTDPKPIIGTKTDDTMVMFSMDAEGATITKSYDGTTDRIAYMVDGTTSLNALEVSLAGSNVNSQNYVLDIVNNMDVVMRSGVMTLNQEVALMPGASFNIMNGGTLKLNNNIYLYDSLEYKKTYSYYSARGISPLHPKYIPSMKVQREWGGAGAISTLPDAQLIVNGNLIMDNSQYGIYTSKSGANISGDGGGIIYMNEFATNVPRLYQMYDFNKYLYDRINLSLAQLKNSNGAYIETQNRPYGTIIRNVRGCWVDLLEEDCFYRNDQNHLFVHTTDYIEVKDTPSSIYQKAWQSADVEDAYFIHTSPDCGWLPVHTVPGCVKPLLKDVYNNYYKYDSEKDYWVPAESYSVIFKNFNGMILENTFIYEGGTPEYTGYTPVRPEDKTGVYTFTGWDPEIDVIDHNTEYTAQYACERNKVSVNSLGVYSYFRTLPEAIDFANTLTTTPTITLLDNITLAEAKTLTKSMTLDLSGYTLTGTASNLLTINGTGADVTIMDSRTDGTIDLQVSAPGAAVTAIQLTNGSLNWNGGKLYVRNTGSYSGETHMTTGVSVASGRTFSMHGGTIETQCDRKSYGVESYGTVHIYDGEITSNTTTSTYAYAYPIYQRGGDVTIDAGSFSATAGSTYASAVRMDGGNTLTINGGTFYAESMSTGTGESNTAAVWVAAGSATIQNATLSAKSANATNLAALYTTKTVSVSDCSLSAVGPAASTYAIRNNGGAVTMERCKTKATTQPIVVSGEGTCSIVSGFFDKNTDLDAYKAAERTVSATPSELPEYTEGYLYNVDVQSYYVSFNGNGATAGEMVSQSFVYNADAKALTATAYERKYMVILNDGLGEGNTSEVVSATFNGWKDANDNTYTDGQAVQNLSEVANAVIVLNAQWTMGTLVLPTPTRKGYTFLGWFDAETDGTKIGNAGAVYEVSENITLYGRWQAQEYTITFDTDGGNTIAPITQAYGTDVTAPADPVKAGFRFNGWSPYLPTTMLAKDFLCTATWVAARYTVVFKNGDDILQSGAFYAGETVEYEGEIPTKSSDDEAEYFFNGWESSLDGQVYTKCVVAGDVVYTPHYEKRLYVAEVLNGEGNRIGASTNFATVAALANENAGATVRLLGDVTLSQEWNITKNLTLDLNGKTINLTTHQLIKVQTENINVKFKDSSNPSTGKVSMNINEGTTEGYAIYISKGSLTILGGTYEGIDSKNDKNTRAGAFKVSGGTLNIQGGSIYASAPNKHAYGYYQDNGTVNISGGTFNVEGNERGWGVYMNGSNAKTDISGGYFKTFGTQPKAIYKSKGTASVTGGFYSHNTDFDGNMPTGYRLRDLKDSEAEYTEGYYYEVTNKVVLPELITDEKTIANGEESTATTLVVSAEGGVLNVNNGATLTATNLIIEANKDKSGEIIPSGTITVDNAYFDFDFQATKYNKNIANWYAFAVPFEVDAMTGITYNGQPVRLAKDMDMVRYNGEIRAALGKDKTAFEYIDEIDDQTLYPGVLYMVAFARNYNEHPIRFAKKSEANLVYSADVNIKQYPSEKAADKNWNAIANPALYKAYLNTGVKTGQVYVNGENRYLPVTFATDNLIVGKPVYVQAKDAESDIVLGANRNAPASVASRVLVADDDIRFDLRLAPEDGKMTDRLYACASSNATDEYTLGDDVAKAGLSSRVAQMWLSAYGQKLCQQTTLLNNNQATWQLGLYAPQYGSYELYVEDIPENMSLYLTYNGIPMWNLAVGSCTLTLEQGNNTAYGLVLNRQEAPNVTTNIENIDSNIIQKVIINDQLFVIVGEHVYSGNGKLVK